MPLKMTKESYYGTIILVLTTHQHELQARHPVIYKMWGSSRAGRIAVFCEASIFISYVVHELYFSDSRW